MSGDMAVRARISGRVQGVWFRGWTKQEAERLGLHGWVRNEADGSVTAVLAGPDGAVNLMLAALRQGPERARVDAVEVERVDADVAEGFAVLR